MVQVTNPVLSYSKMTNVDNITGVTANLLALGIVAGVAGNVLKEPRQRRRRFHLRRRK